ncbi:unnamed protein product, partial [Bubo scandiacus]
PAGAGTRWGVRCLEPALARATILCGCEKQELLSAGVSTGCSTPWLDGGGSSKSARFEASWWDRGEQPGRSHRATRYWRMRTGAAMFVLVAAALWPKASTAARYWHMRTVAAAFVLVAAA